MLDVSLVSIEAILPFIAIGFAAQLVDGALGMAFGLINSTLLISVMGLPPRVASASVHVLQADAQIIPPRDKSERGGAP